MNPVVLPQILNPQHPWPENRNIISVTRPELIRKSFKGSFREGLHTELSVSGLGYVGQVAWDSTCRVVCGLWLRPKV